MTDAAGQTRTAVVLARGLGTRMRAASPAGSDLTSQQAVAAASGYKALMPIGGHRLIDYSLAALADAGIERAVLVVGPEHEDFRRHIDSLRLTRLTIDLAVQREPLGTADAVLSAEAAVDGEPFLMVNGDNYYPHRALRDLARHRGTALAGFDRAAWARLADRTPLPLTQDDIDRIASLGDPIDMQEVDAIYRPLSALLHLYVDGRRRTAAERHAFLGEPAPVSTPFVIGIAGSVAVGKSTVARLLQLLLQRWDSTPRVDLITTDGFLHPNKVLEERGIIARKGFPESYDRAALIAFLSAVKAGAPSVSAPVYSHVVYDIIPGEEAVVSRPDILIVEGLNVLQPPRALPGSVSIAVSDYFDFSIYVDADESHIEQWYVDRFLKLRATAFAREDSFFRTYAGLSDAEAESTARMVWRAINLPNLRENIRPTRERAELVFTKGADHRVESLKIRKE